VPKSSEDQSIVTRIRKHYDLLPKSERKLADLILDFPGDIAGYSATELSELSGVSKAAVTRLIRRLGFKNFEEARRMARDAKDWGSPLYLLSQERDDTEIQGALKVHLDRDIANMTRTFEALNETTLKNIISAITKAKKVSLLGLRNSHFLAAYAQRQFLQLRDNVHLIAQGGETLAENLAGLDDKDLLIAFGFRRRRDPFRNALKQAHQAGTRIVYITDPTVGPTVKYATWVLPVEVAGVGVFDSYTSAMSLIHHLCSALLAKTGQSSRERLKRIEDLHDALGDFG
jgi:DNA-binding MurR/RpiR family transcriptional regulator